MAANDDNDTVWRPCENVAGYGARDYDDVPRSSAETLCADMAIVDAINTAERSEEHKALDALGHVAYVIILLGHALIANKLIAGWLLVILGDVMWVWLGWRLRLTSVWVWQTVFIAVAAYGWWNWS